MLDTSASSAWPPSYSEHVTRAVQRSARNLDLYYLLLRHVARGDVAAATLADATATVLSTRGPSYVAQLTTLHASFFANVIGVVTGAAEAPPDYDANDPARWLQQLVAFAARAQAHGVRALTDAVADSAAGHAAPKEWTAPTPLTEVGRLLLDLVGGTADAAAAFEEVYLRDMLQLAHAGRQENAALQLIARPGETASTWLTLENVRDRRARLRCAVGDVRRPDGVGPAFVPAVAVEPGALELDPGQEATVQLSLVIDGGLYEPDVPYVGSVHVVDDGATPTVVPVLVPLCITSRPPADRRAVRLP
jgi:hypothetical protein